MVRTTCTITQPITVTDMRRDPKSLLERVKKEGVVPILTHSEFEAAIISVDELNRLYESIKELKHELFVQETLEAIEEHKRDGGIGPVEDIDEFMKLLNKEAEENED
ncbi:type II toxin-antitoxin system prevent-host-death family antitoxin [Candidatus Peregrinibacteria bacterium]|nr:type II toxin-antitoxin system prevent-host-death family antitoxin [Candidatus Peregrinibacteria bacterium]